MKNKKANSVAETDCKGLKCIGLAVIMFGLAAHATQYVVPGGAGDLDGSSWANAWADVQSAVDAATLPGEEVWVAAGRYELTAPVILRSDSVVLGGFVGTESAAEQRDWDANVTILDGQDTIQPVRMDVIADARFDGFVVTRGYFYATSAKFMGGGGILITGSVSCAVANCKILHNQSERLAGSSGNTCEGGGVYINNATDCVLENCLFTDNKSKYHGTDLSLVVANGVTVKGCRFIGSDNISAGGIIRSQNTAGWVINCLSSGNVASYGSFMYVSQRLSVINCTICFTSNKTGNGVFNTLSDNLIRNNILAFNTPAGIVEMNNASSSPYVENNLFHAQPAGVYYDKTRAIYLSDAEELNTNMVPARAFGNVDGDPRFVRCPTVDDGTWSSVGVYDEERAQTTLFDTNAALRPGALKGRCLNPNTAATLYRHAEIADNTATSITVWGKADWADTGSGYRIYDFRLREDSPALNAGLVADAPETDLDGNPRPAMGGIDIGAYEAQPQPGTKILIQ